MTPAASGDRLAELLDKLNRGWPGAHWSVGPGDQDAVIAGFALVRVIAMQASAVQASVRDANAAAAGANLRSLFEAWLDLRYLLLHGDRRTNAIRYWIFAHLELRKFLVDTNEPADVIAPVDQELSRLQQAAPDVYSQIEAEHRGGSLYWSGLSRKGLVAEVGEKWQGGKDVLRRTYKLHAWDGHHIMVLLKDVRIVTTATGVEIGFGFGPPSAGGDDEYLLGEACGALSDGWTVFREAFGLPDL